MDGDGWGLTGDGRGGATAMDSATVTRQQGTVQWQLDGDGQRGTVQAQWQ